MYYPDLTPCGALPQSRFKVLPLAVGWLDPQHEYPRGVVADAVLERLWAFCDDPPVMSFGIHSCEFCGDDDFVRSEVFYKGTKMLVGSCDIIIIGRRRKVYYAPDMIIHYIIDHSYLPPADFLDAVLACPLPDTKRYARALRGLVRRSFKERVRDTITDVLKLVGLGPKEPPSYEDQLAGKYVDHQSSESLRNHAHMLAQAWRGTESIEYLDKALQLNGEDALAHCMRGYTLYNIGRHDEVIPNMERAAELFAKQGPAQFHQEAKARHFLGLLLFERGEHEAGLQQIQQAADLHRTYGRAFDADHILKELAELKDGASVTKFFPMRFPPQ